MNLLYTLTSYPPSTGGAQTLAHQLACQMRQHHAVQVVSHWDSSRTDWLMGTTLNAPSTPRDYVVDGVPVHRMGFGWAERLQMAALTPFYYPFMAASLPSVAQGFAQVIERHLAPFAARADLIHNTRIGREGLSLASFKVARQRGVPFVLTPVHHPRWVGWRYRDYLRLYQQADALIALTAAEKQILLGLGVRDERVFVSGMGPTLAATANAAQFRQRFAVGGPMVLFLGQHYPYKGYKQLLQAATLVWQRVPEAEFVFVGPQHGEAGQILAAHADRRIHALGAVDVQTKTDGLAACDLLCVPSTQESFGGIYTEAWHFAKPVIGCPIPAVAEVISEGEDGYLVAQQPAEIAERVCDLLLNQTRAAEMGRRGQLKTAANFTWAHIAERTQTAYNFATGLAG